MTEAPLYRAGHRFEGPDGQSYELLNDVISGRPIMACEFKPLNGAPEPRTGQQMPDWLAKQVSVGGLWLMLGAWGRIACAALGIAHG